MDLIVYVIAPSAKMGIQADQHTRGGRLSTGERRGYGPVSRAPLEGYTGLHLSLGHHLLWNAVDYAAGRRAW